MHDYDKNTKLDGLELLKSMTHFHDEHEEDHKDKENKDGRCFFLLLILWIGFDGTTVCPRKNATEINSQHF